MDLKEVVTKLKKTKRHIWPIAGHLGTYSNQWCNPSGYSCRRILALANMPGETLNLAGNLLSKYLGILYSDTWYQNVGGYYHDIERRIEDVALFEPSRELIKRMSQKIDDLRGPTCFDSYNLFKIAKDIEMESGHNTQIFYTLRMSLEPGNMGMQYIITENGERLYHNNKELYKQKEDDITPLRNLPNTTW